MSATIQEQLLSKYFSTSLITVPRGKRHFVKNSFLEDIYGNLYSEFAENSPTTNAQPFSNARKPLGMMLGEVNTFMQRHYERLIGIRQAYPLDSSRARNIDTGSGAGEYSSLVSIRDLIPYKQLHDIIAETIIHIVNNNIVNPIGSESSAPSSTGNLNSILVFLSGMDGIRKVHRILSGRLKNSGKDNVSIHILHGSLPWEQQRRAFYAKKSDNSKPFWRILLSTAISETSVTFDDCLVRISLYFYSFSRLQLF